ncbi:phosphatase PAP2 family protein [Desulfotruncus alcoholivorax]|uniref:phosphatase PAP2 family protein n=1 Tax=Desulfotruncus alcoholivorax TaxID=265477 RepID=UPI0003FA073B|nr:phosphatase PAP2 family protein [Desulfotruncus alcoholivorax]
MNRQAFLILPKATWILTIPLLGLVYARLNHNNGHVYSLVTSLDGLIPLCTYFVVPYILWYGLSACILFWFLLKNERLYYNAITSINIGIIICLFIYFFFQTTVVRPAVQGQDIFSQLTNFVYHMDKPYNAFPSIHVLTCYVIYLSCKRARVYGRNISLLIQGVTILVAISTLFLKQHTLLDIGGGIFIGGIILNVIEYLEKNPTSKRIVQYVRNLAVLQGRSPCR